MAKLKKKIRFSGILGLVLIVALAVFVSSVGKVMADTSATSASVTNALPVASGADIDSGAVSVTLTENTTTSVTCTATITDNNGCDDITGANYVFYRTAVTSGCAADDNDCYTGSCTIDGGTCTGVGDVDLTVTCSISAQYYADPTDAGSPQPADDWTCEVTPSDGAGAGTADTDTIEMDSLLALDVTAAIAYGELALGADTGAVNQTTTVTNTGNRAIDPEISGTAMTCTAGSIPVGNQEYSDVAFTWGVGGTDLSGTPTRQELTLPQRTAGVITDNVEWGLGMEATGVGGSCSGTNTFTAIAD